MNRGICNQKTKRLSRYLNDYCTGNTRTRRQWIKHILSYSSDDVNFIPVLLKEANKFLDIKNHITEKEINKLLLLK